MNISTTYVKAYTEKNTLIIVLQSNRTKSTYYGVKFEGNKVIWRTEKDASGINKGRWRNTLDDEKIGYKIIGNELVLDIIYSDGGVDRSRYIIK